MLLSYHSTGGKLVRYIAIVVLGTAMRMLLWWMLDVVVSLTSILVKDYLQCIP